MKIKLDDNHFQKGWIKQTKEEIAEFIEFITLNTSIKYVIEVGAFCGGTALIWAQIVEPLGGKILTIDLHFGHKRIPPVYRNTRWGRFVQEFQGRSQDEKTIGSIKKCLDGRAVDFLFIDADHSYEAVKKDFENYSPFVRKKGWIAFHDIANSTVGVKDFWAELKPRFENKEFIVGAGIGVIKWV